MAIDELFKLVSLTFVQAALSALLSAAIGLGIGLGVQPYRTLRSILLLPFTMPSIVVASTWIFWFGHQGPLGNLGWIYSLSAVVGAHVVINAPYVAGMVAQALDRLERERWELSATLGARFPARFRHVLWPELREAWAQATFQAFAFSVSSFALVMLLGGGPPVETLETALYARVRFEGLDFRGALVCAVASTALAIGPWLLWSLRKRARTGQASLQRDFMFSSNAYTKVAAGLAGFGLVGFFSPAFWPKAFPEGETLGPALRDSLELSLAVAILSAGGAGALNLALIRLRRSRPLRARAMATAFFALGALSPLVLGLLLWVLVDRWFDPLEHPAVAVGGVQTLSFLPLAFRMLWPVGERSAALARETAGTLGASRWAEWRWAEWPRWRGPLFRAWALCAAFSLGELSVVSLFYTEQFVPLPLLASRLMGRYEFAQAHGIAWILVMLALSLVVVSGGMAKGRRNLHA